MNRYGIEARPQILPELDRDFRPASIEYRAFLRAVDGSGKAMPVRIALERENGNISTFETRTFDDGHPNFEAGLFYIERLVKTLLWARGGWKITIGGPQQLCRHIEKTYRGKGGRQFDVEFMGQVYEKPFTVEVTDTENVPDARSEGKSIGRHLDGRRIGFDAGGSDRKVSAVIDGKSVFSEEVVWHPKVTEDPDYHYREIMSAMKTAASHLPAVDAIGVSAAGIYIDNRVMAASLFIKVPRDLFESKVKNIFLDIAREMGDVPIQVANDGDVTALAGAMNLNDTNVFGLAMGTSEAVGYVDAGGNITGDLNELAFVPIDYNPEAAVHEWSKDRGCGANYFSQESAIRLAPAAGIELDAALSPAEKLKIVQQHLDESHPGAVKIFESIGVYLGYALGYYSEFYDIKHVLVLGRVTSGEGGPLIIENAEKVLKAEFPELASAIKLHLPDETSRRVGQSIAAASLPEIG